VLRSVRVTPCLFSDDEICCEREEYHIWKEQKEKGQSKECDDHTENTIEDLAEQVRNGSDNYWMDSDISDISDYEVKSSLRLEEAQTLCVQMTYQLSVFIMVTEM